MAYVDSFNIEFGYELLSAVPYAYELYLKGELEGTRSGYDTDSLYYFSPKHEINMGERSWFNTDHARHAGLPYTFIHQPELQPKAFPPYKEHFANKKYKFKKPTICICNRYNAEWSHKPINFFDTAILEWMFTKLKGKYEIVYFPVGIPVEIRDNEQPLPMNDIEVAKKHGVKIFTELCEGYGWNETMLKVFANCERYITMNGGYSILASMFSGTNIIYSKPGEKETRELKLKSFTRWYPNINNVRTVYVPSYDELKAKIRALYIDDLPCVNIIVRTHRPNYLKECIKSIKSQTYQNINLVLVCDSDAAVAYTREYNARMIRVFRDDTRGERPNDIEYGVFFPYNRYLDEAQRKVNGYLLFIDDDDQLFSDTVETIVENIQKDTLLLWKVDFKEMGLIPKNTFGEKITLYDITGIGFCYHSDWVDHTDWTQWKRADYRTAKRLSEVLKVKWLDEVITGIQDRPGAGVKGDLRIDEGFVIVKMTFPDGRSLKQKFTKAEIAQYEGIYKLQGICIEQQN